MKLKISIEYSNPTLPVSNVAQILSSLALIHEGMNFMLNGSVEELEETFSDLSRIEPWPIALGPPFPPFYDWRFLIRELPEALYTMGQSTFEVGNDDVLRKLPVTFLDFPIQTLLRSFKSESVPELALVKKGSLEAEIEKIIERLRKIFGLVISSPSILPQAEQANDAKKLLDFLEELGTESRNQSSRYIGAGITTVGAGMLAIGYRELNVTRVGTSSSDDDDEPVFENEDVGAY